MENTDLKSSASADLNQLQAKFEALHHLVISVLIMLVIVSGTMTIFLLRQWSLARKDLAAARPVANQIITEFNNNKERAARMDGFVSRLVDYSRTHTNFVPILVKHGINPAGPTGAPAAAAAGQQKK